MKFGQLCAVAIAATKIANASNCKCAPGDSCWPSDAVWTALNETVSGRLLKTVLPGSVCYKDQPNYDEAACQAVLSNWTTAAFHSADQVSVHSPWYANNSCNPIHDNGTSPSGDPLAGSRGCTMGRYPAYSVNVTSAEDVQAAVKFAREHNLRLNVKNTGHGYSKSIAYGSLSFRPEMPYAQLNHTHTSVGYDIGAGIQDDEAFRAAAEHGVAVVGGTNADVGLVGWAVAGGHGWLTSEYGMGADSIIEATVVTPTGDIITANECQNSDVFWAIRGSGGGTFGVITELTVKAHPMPQATTWILSVDKSPKTTVKDWWSLIADLHTELPALQAGEALARPVMSRLQDAASEVTVSSNITYFSDWFTVYEMLPVAAMSGAAGGGGATVSRLIPAAPLTDNVQKMAQVLEAVGPRAEPPSSGISNPTIAGGLIANSVPVDNALNPAWRVAVVAYAVDDATDRVGGALRSLAPESGAYINEADDREPDWQRTFWGPNYDRLREIKKKYDPDSIQWCHRCVGSEDWVELMDGRLCRSSSQ
ncbi:FAD binding domain protein [Colletotrichum asianum]|uniref:FAD binding domain protein n=1 Tax=Colletotrichum asianum TaxID=702518 RepID=A0A8H3ZW96_9PEZI|nr:FAD binding domain protein [Colletotrichum asianum]